MTQKPRDTTEGESGCNPYKVSNTTGKTPVHNPKEWYPSKKAKYSDERQPWQTMQQTEKPEYRNTGETPPSLAGQPQDQQETREPKSQTAISTQNSNEEEQAQTLQELAIPQNQNKTLAAVVETQDRTNYWEIVE